MYLFPVDQYLRYEGADAVDHLLEERGRVPDGAPVAGGTGLAVQKLKPLGHWMEKEIALLHVAYTYCII